MIDGVLIDPATTEVSPVQLAPGDLDRIYELLGCDRFAVAYLEGDAVVYIDDEGLLKPNSFFFHEPEGQFFAGRALVLGTDPDGNSASSPFTDEQVREQIDFGQVFRVGSHLMFMGERNVREVR